MKSHRTLSAIAMDISKDWIKPSPYAVPYLQAMHTLRSLNDSYYYDSAHSIVLYFLGNATTWRGEKAREIKKELNKMLKDYKENDQSVLRQIYF